ncbi:MAG: hypothetical protein LBB89_09850 [Treponema sp.]|jgi:hypothetical protein|nr:hypothetical protein [Treponema sp.]
MSSLSINIKKEIFLDSLKKSLFVAIINIFLVFAIWILINIFANCDFFIAVILGIINGIIIANIIKNGENKILIIVFSIILSVIISYLLSKLMGTEIIGNFMFPVNEDKSFDSLNVFAIKIIMVSIFEVFTIIVFLFVLLFNYVSENHNIKR